MNMGQFKTDIARTDKEVIVSIQISGLLKETFNIDVNNDRIKIIFTSKNTTDESSGNNIAKKKSVSSYVKILPIPEDAAPGSNKVDISGETIKIRFDRKINNKQ